MDSRFNAFMEVYGSYLGDAIEDDCKQSVLDFLYVIPKKMKDDFSKFGFLEKEKQEYVWEYRGFGIADKEFQLFWEPGIECQVPLVY